MNMILLLGLIIAIGLSALLLISRNESWCSDKFRFGLTGTLLILGVLGLLLFETKTDNQISFLKWIQIPFINSLLDRLFKIISYKIHNRDLLLYMRGSSDLDMKYRNPNLKTSDYIFSILLIIFMMTLPVFYGL